MGGSDDGGEKADSVLLTRAAGGDVDAQRALLRRYGARLRAVALRITCDARLAEEVTQDTFVTLLRDPTSVRDHSSLSAWLYRVASNRAHDARRSERRHRHSPLRSVDEICPGPSAHRIAERRDLRRTLDRAIAALPEEMGQVVVLRYFGGLDYRSIAESLNCSEGSVASRLHRGVRHLNSWMAEHGFTRETI